MKRTLKIRLEKWFTNFTLFQVVAGGYRYYRAIRENPYRPEEYLHYGKGVRIEAGVNIGAPERLYVGDDVGISQGCSINAVGGCHIGRGCQIAAETVILTTEHQYSGGKSLPFDPVRLVKPVYIEDYVWIGTRALIAPGVRIGEGAVIAMGSIVVQDVPPLAIVAGNPARVLMYRGKEDFELAKKSGTVIDATRELPLLRVPPVTKRKYKAELQELGFDVSKGQEYFKYDKNLERSERLVAVKDPASLPK